MQSERSVEEVLQGCSPRIRELAESLRRLVHQAAPEATERGMKGWGNIVYERKGIFCYIGPQKNWVNLGFYRGVDLPDPEGLLEGTGKALRHVKVRKAEDIQTDTLQQLVKEAYRLAAS